MKKVVGLFQPIFATLSFLKSIERRSSLVSTKLNVQRIFTQFVDIQTMMHRHNN